MAGLGGERPPHRGLGVFDRALAIAREAVIDPGVGPARVQLDGGGEGLFGARGLAERRKSLAIGVMRRRELRRAPAGFARRDERGLIVAEREMRDGGVKERRRIVRERGLRLRKARERVGVSPRGLQAPRRAETGFAGRSGRARRRGSGARSPRRRRWRAALRPRDEAAAMDRAAHSRSRRTKACWRASPPSSSPSGAGLPPCGEAPDRPPTT